MVERIKKLAEHFRDEIISFRRHLHAHPELSFEEHATSRYIQSVLTKYDIDFKNNLGGGTGVLATLGSGSGVIALRADIDALPIHEENSVPYCSTNPGVMHACGHDVHTSSLLGTVLILKELENELDSQIRCIFQPGEEKLPGGASKMIEDGVLYNPRVRSIHAQHVHPALPVGKVGYRRGWFMASADEIFITVKGRGGHAARPQDIQDTILVSAEIIQSLQTIVSRSTDPLVGSVLSIGKINSVGGATNVIPNEVKMEGTFRTFDEKWRYRAHDLIRRKIGAIADAHGVVVDLNIFKGYPSLYNDPKVTGNTSEWMKAYVGDENVVELPPRMTSEDFSYYSQEVPACFYRLGTASPDGRNGNPVHTPVFDIDESALEVGSGLMAWIAYNASKG